MTSWAIKGLPRAEAGCIPNGSRLAHQGYTYGSPFASCRKHKGANGTGGVYAVCFVDGAQSQRLGPGGGRGLPDRAFAERDLEKLALSSGKVESPLDL
jgi:hypothetical protein